MSNSTPWTPYAGSSSLILAVVLVISAGVLAYCGIRLRHPRVATQPGLFLGACIIVMWLLSVTTFLVAVIVYVQALIAQVGSITSPPNPITPFTLAAGVIAFFLILYLTLPSVTSPINLRQLWVSFVSAVVGTIAAPMIFELPYDLIVLWRTHPPAPAALFTLLFFLPLFLVEIASFALLTFSPFMSLSRTTLFLLAGMFSLFAVWALFGFAYPSTPIPFALNVSSKIVAFAVAVSLFLPQKRAAKAKA